MGQFLKRTEVWRVCREILALRIPVYGANACFFLVLAVFPALLLLLGLLQWTALTPEGLTALLRDFLPEALLPAIRALLRLAWENTSGAAVGLSAATVLWSAGRGMYGILTGLDRVYGRSGQRGWLRTRLLSLLYTAGGLLVLPVLTALSLPVRQWAGPGWLLLFAGRTGLFGVCFMVLPAGRRSFRESLPGALLTAVGWTAFSAGYSRYVVRFSPLSNVYGSVYAISLGMLWLYWCLCIFFGGGAVNAVLAKRKNM